MSFLTPPPPVFFLPKRSLAAFSGYLTVEESGSDVLEITQHPIQNGAAITDHAFKKPVSVDLKLSFDSLQQPLVTTYKKLRELQESRIPFNCVTGKRTYANMLMGSLAVMTDVTTENILSVAISLQEVILVSVEKTTVAPRTQQADPGKTGATDKTADKSAESSPQLREQTDLSKLLNRGVL
jgi:hypothetical protein